MRKHKHYAEFHKGGNRNDAEVGRVKHPRLHGLLSGWHPLTPRQRAGLAKRATIYLNSSAAKHNAVAAKAGA
jgi:hypothetical protein